jgi:putative ABC transport system permease protein
MDALMQDFSYAWRGLRRAPGIALLAVLCMALGIGAVTTVYGTASAFTFRPLPQVRDAERMLYVYESPVNAPMDFGGVSPAAFRDLQSLASFSDVGAVAYWQASIEGDEIAERVVAARVSSNTLRTLGRAPMQGRDFTRAHDLAGSERVVLLGHALWQRRFGGDPALVDRTVRINGEPYTVVGILPEDFKFPTGTELLVPLALTPEQWAERGSRELFVLGRLANGAAAEQAAAELAVIGERNAAAYPDVRTAWTIRQMPAEDYFGSGARPFMIVLLASAVFVLLIACANAANLLLVRATERRREIAMRLALGATPWRIGRETLAESVLIGVAAGVLGCLLALWGLHLTSISVPVDVQRYIPGFGQLRLDAQALALTAACAVGSGLLFGLLPAFGAIRTDVQRDIRDSGRGNTGTRHTRLMRNTLVVVEVGLALQLMVGAALMAATFQRLAGSNLGFQKEDVLTLGVTLPPEFYASDGAVVRYLDALQDRVAALPGVEAVGATSVLPMSWVEARTSVKVEGSPLTLWEEAPTVGVRRVSASYAHALGIPLLQGRSLHRQDGPDAPSVALISEAAARRLWPREPALGKRIAARTLGGGEDWIEIVGVVGDVRANPLTTNDPLPVLYVHDQQWPARTLTLVVRAKYDPEALTAAVRREIAALDPRFAAGDVATMDAVIATATSPQSATAQVLLAAALIALLMSAAGTYGVVAYSAGQRTREFGVRIALGACPSSVIGLVLRQSLKLVGVGVVLGIAGALAMGRAMRAILYETDASDPVVIGSVALALTAVALLASWVPARRSVRLSPLAAIRDG